MAGKSLQAGAHLAAVFSEREAPLDPAQARQLLDTLLRLFELGALVFGGEGPTVYNMGPSVHRDTP